MKMQHIRVLFLVFVGLSWLQAQKGDLIAVNFDPPIHTISWVRHPLSNMDGRGFISALANGKFYRVPISEVRKLEDEGSLYPKSGAWEMVKEGMAPNSTLKPIGQYLYWSSGNKIYRRLHGRGRIEAYFEAPIKFVDFMVTENDEIILIQPWTESNQPEEGQPAIIPPEWRRTLSAHDVTRPWVKVFGLSGKSKKVFDMPEGISAPLKSGLMFPASVYTFMADDICFIHSHATGRLFTLDTGRWKLREVDTPWPKLDERITAKILASKSHFRKLGPIPGGSAYSALLEGADFVGSNIRFFPMGTNSVGIVYRMAMLSADTPVTATMNGKPIQAPSTLRVHDDLTRHDAYEQAGIYYAEILLANERMAVLPLQKDPPSQAAFKAYYAIEDMPVFVDGSASRKFAWVNKSAWLDSRLKKPSVPPASAPKGKPKVN